MESAHREWKRSSKALLILSIGILAVIVVNVLRVVTKDLPSFQITKEGLNVTIIIYAVCAAFVGWLSSNKDRPIFACSALGYGLAATLIVWAFYPSVVVVLTVLGEVAFCSFFISRIPVPYP